MPTPTKGPRLGGSPTHERLMLNNMAAQLFEHKQIKTTVTKAKRLRPVAERMITNAKQGDLASRRRVLAQISDKSVVHELFTSIAEAMAERPGGYTRITKVGNRKGDNAPMAVIELVLEPYSPKQATVKEAEAAVKSASKPAPADDAAAGPAAGADAADAAEPAEEAAASADAEPAEAADAGADAADAPADADAADSAAESAEGADDAEGADEK